MAKKTVNDGWRKWDGGKALKDRFDKKDEPFRAPGDRVFYYVKSAIKAFVPKEGKNRLRILQPREVFELDFYGLDIHFHRSVGDEGDSLFGDYLCNRRMKKFIQLMYGDIEMSGNCFICQQQTPDLWDTNADLAKTYYPNERMWFFVLDLLSDDPDEVKIWSCPWTLYKEILSRSTDEETGRYINVSDPWDGVPISFERQGQGKLTRYVNVQIFKKAMPVSDDIYKQIPLFKDLLVIPKYDDVKSAFLSGKPEQLIAQQTDDLSDEQTEIDDTNDDIKDEPDGPPECFKKEHDKWVECEECEYSVPCAEGMKPSRPSRTGLKVVDSSKDEEKEDSEKVVDKQSIREKIKQAQEKIKKNKAE